MKGEHMKNICRNIIGIILVIMIISSTNIALAVSQSEINAQKNQQSQINNQIDEAEEKQKQIESEKSKTMQQVDFLKKPTLEDYMETDRLTREIARKNVSPKIPPL